MLMPAQCAGTARQTNVVAVPLARVKEVTKTTTTIGAAQKDTARELGEKLKATRPALWVGIGCILACAAFIYFGWYTPALIAGGTGVGLMLFSQAIATETTLLLAVAGAAIAILGVFYAYHKGMLDKVLHHGTTTTTK
jgi:hypothetical protein